VQGDEGVLGDLLGGDAVAQQQCAEADQARPVLGVQTLDGVVGRFGGRYVVRGHCDPLTRGS
jgi:hypothetical protein